MSLLIVYQGYENIDQRADYSYSLDLGQVKNTESLNNANKLNATAVSLRDEYSDYIYSINEQYLKNKLVYKNKISLYFLSDLSNKRTELFQTFSTICHIDLLNECVKQNDITRVRFINCDKNFIDSFKSKIDIPIEEDGPVNYKTVKNYFLRQIVFFTKYIFALCYIKIFYKNTAPKRVKNIFLSRFPLHFDKAFNEEKYGFLVKSNDYFLISIFTDGMHQGLGFFESIKAAIDLKKNSERKNIIFLDREVSIRDLLGNFLYSLWIYYNFRRLYSNTYVFKGVNISGYIFEELDHSILRIPRLTLYRNALKRVFKKTNVSNFYYYLHEYSYGKFFTFILSQYFPNVNRVGFQHGPASMRKILYFLSKNEVNYDSKDAKYYLPMPNMILAEDEQSALVYEAANYKHICVMEKIPRLAYLENIKRSNIEKGSVLVACGLHDGSYIFNSLKDEIKSNPDKKYYFKLHPRSNIKVISKDILEMGLTNIEISEDHISKYLSLVDEVVFTYSSVGQEAYKLGIKIRIVSLPGKINESPLFGTS